MYFFMGLQSPKVVKQRENESKILKRAYLEASNWTMSISVCSAVLRNNSKTQLFMTKQGANSDESRGARWT